MTKLGSNSVSIVDSEPKANGHAAVSLTCKTCRHWHALPRPTVGNMPGGVVDLSKPLTGQCRERLCTVPQIVGQGAVVVAPYYPNVPEDWPACGRYEGRGE